VNGLLVLVSMRRRADRAEFWLALPVVLAVAVGSAVAMMGGAQAAALPYLGALWGWLSLHVNRRHDAGRSGRILVLLTPFLALGALAAGAAVVLASEAVAASPSVRPHGGEPIFVVVYELVFAFGAFVSLAESTIRALATGLATALLAPCALASAAIGFAASERRANRWGPPAPQITPAAESGGPSPAG
jgi:uncharacterized membrane protein YhaH (DUF805 family)